MSAAEFDWFPFYATDTLADTNFQGWTCEERGAWLSLVLLCWHDGSIPADQDALRRVLHLTAPAMSVVWQAISTRFAVSPDKPGRLVSPRLEKEREKARIISKERAKAGEKGGLARAKQLLGKRKASGKRGLTPRQPPIQPQPPEQLPDSLWLAGIAKRVAQALNQGAVGLGADEKRKDAERAIRRVVALAGEDAAVSAMAQIATQHLHGQVGALTAFTGWLDRIPDAEWLRVGGSA